MKKLNRNGKWGRGQGYKRLLIFSKTNMVLSTKFLHINTNMKSLSLVILLKHISSIEKAQIIKSFSSFSCRISMKGLQSLINDTTEFSLTNIVSLAIAA